MGRKGRGRHRRDSQKKRVQRHVGHTGVSQSDARISYASNGASSINLILGFLILQVALQGKV